ncbi:MULTISPECIES: ketopantoate reductase family protein [Methanobacterium]|jgi:2-dehydropantoate 2-reductase|uniref:2-dehydropantoate 2-reductase n=1 Tax=Methanobacterium veterum TaxID=408577 RepID=A0A9E5A3U0_9EURY|nr:MULTISPECIES: 2-dehydropantoate 2-reductase [Methanobacterium]MCZ3366732.1 2-dehydropantoate 2-reductase [Methanobacterium veterum]MCZ3374122.1 2-dehydropantoate 2-reductase [Methanobacterium veterum]
MKYDNEIKRICIYGTGGVGGFFGGKMANESEIFKELEIYFIARGDHLHKIQERGLILNTVQEKEIICKPTDALKNYNEIPAPDLVLICVKGYDLDAAVDKISGNIKDDTIIIPLLNGVDIYNRIRKKLQAGIILPACVYVGTYIEKPGVVTQTGGEGKIIMGKDPNYPLFVPNSIIDLFNNLNIDHEWVGDSFPAIWEKYIFIAPFGLVSAAYDKSLGELMANSKLREQVQKIMEEIVSIAVFEGVKLKETIIEESLEKANNFPYETTTSYHKDIEKGKKNEGDLFGGTIIRLGKKYNIPTPVTEKLDAIIQNKLEEI